MGIMNTSRVSLSNPSLLTWGLLVLILMGIIGAVGCSASAQNSPADWRGVNPTELPPAPKVGRLAPDFTLTTLDGDSITLSDFRGKSVFVNFWATWCPPCRAEMPDIETIYQEYKDKDLVVIGVDLREAPDSVRRFVEDGGYNWTFVIDSDGEVATSYWVASIPTSFFVDKHGIIRVIQIGTMTTSTMKRILDAAIN